MLVCLNKQYIAHLVLQMNTKGFYAVAHGVSRANTRYISQWLQNRSLLWWLFEITVIRLDCSCFLQDCLWLSLLSMFLGRYRWGMLSQLTWVAYVMTLVWSLYHISLLDLIWMRDNVDFLFLYVVVVLLLVLKLGLCGMVLFGVLVPAYERVALW